MNRNEMKNHISWSNLNIVLAIWLLYYLMIALKVYFGGMTVQPQFTFLMVAAPIIDICFNVIFWVLLSTVSFQMLRMVFVGAVAAIPLAIMMSITHIWLNPSLGPNNILEDLPHLSGNELQITYWRYVVGYSFDRYFVLIAWITLYAAINFAKMVRIAERRAASIIAASQQAEMRALRYQINPHFLFNTLNSLSTLVLKDRLNKAVEMLNAMKVFFQSSLQGDVLEDVTLEDEIRLQKLYLEIEAVRFPKRLICKFDVEPAVLPALIPQFILQPVIENSIKYAVSKSAEPTTIQIKASKKNAFLDIKILDDGKFTGKTNNDGTGIGLNNISNRLMARYGNAAYLQVDQSQEVGFCVNIRLPLLLN